MCDHNHSNTGGEPMTAKERVRALLYLEKQKKNPELAKKLGIEVKMKEESHDYEIMKCSLLDFSRSLVRHDSDKIRESLQLILERMN
jgi:hypothetical protein